MPFALAEDMWVQLTVSGRYASQEVDNVFHARIISSGGSVFPISAGSTALLAGFQAAWRTSICPLLSSGYAVDHFMLDELLTPAPGPNNGFRKGLWDILFGDPELDVGSGGNVSLPSYAAVNAYLSTGFRGRSFKGRKAFGPIPEAQTDSAISQGNLLTDAAKVAWDAAAAIIAGTITIGAGATGFRFAGQVASLLRYNLGNTGFMQLTTGVIVRRPMGTQNSRKQKNRGA